MVKMENILDGRCRAAWLKSLGGRGGKPPEKYIVQFDIAFFSKYEGNTELLITRIIVRRLSKIGKIEAMKIGKYMHFE
jgi:hypothetical protein